MVVLPEGFALPPYQYVFVLATATILVSAVLFAVHPSIDQRLALGLAPWMGVGGGLHAFYQLGAYPSDLRPLFGTPAVYLTTFVLAGTVWALVALKGRVQGRPDAIPRNLGFTGMGVLTVLIVVAARIGFRSDTLEPVWPAIAFVLAIAMTVLTVVGIALWQTPAFVRTRYVGPTVVFAHALDGVTTAIGADVLGVRERSPIPRQIMEFAADLPTAELLGVGWLFLLVKLTLTAAIVILFSDYVDEDPAQATVVLSVVVAVGLGPATNNLFLFMVGMQ